MKKGGADTGLTMMCRCGKQEKVYENSVELFLVAICVFAKGVWEVGGCEEPGRVNVSFIFSLAFLPCCLTPVYADVLILYFLASIPYLSGLLFSQKWTSFWLRGER